MTLKSIFSRFLWKKDFTDILERNFPSQTYVMYYHSNQKILKMAFKGELWKYYRFTQIFFIKSESKIIIVYFSENVYAFHDFD